MSVICAVKFADGVVTRMTVFDYSGDVLDIGRALSLAVAAYENRMKRPPPLITTPESIAGAPDILGYQWMTADGKISSMTTAAEYKRTLLFMSMFAALGDKHGNDDKPNNDGEPTTPHRGRRRRRPRPRSTAEWEELNRRRDLRKLAQAKPELRHEILNTFERCPCCDRSLDHSKDGGKAAVAINAMAGEGHEGVPHA
jgi:hypothetical protein